MNDDNKYDSKYRDGQFCPEKEPRADKMAAFKKFYRIAMILVGIVVCSRVFHSIATLEPSLTKTALHSLIVFGIIFVVASAITMRAALNICAYGEVRDVSISAEVDADGRMRGYIIVSAFDAQGKEISSDNGSTQKLWLWPAEAAQFTYGDYCTFLLPDNPDEHCSSVCKIPSERIPGKVRRKMGIL